jgi:type VI secretion system protein ImpJ
MKVLSKVVWAEGMYLAPHHFQAQNRYFEESAHFATTGLWNDAYGFTDYELGADALRDGTVTLSHACGIFEDGLAFDMPESDPLPASYKFADRFPPTADHLTICLAVPPWYPDRRNCNSEESADGNTRYRRVTEMRHDENTGRDEKPVQLGQKNISLVSDRDSGTNLLNLPLARILRDNTGQFINDPKFVPPCVRLSASAYLTGMLKRLVETLEEKSSAVATEQQQPQGKFQAGMSARHVSQFWFLHAINSSLTPLRHLPLSKNRHPAELFREMSRLAGALCTFGLDSHPGSLPVYNHRDPSSCFEAVDEHIRRHLEIMVPSLAVVIPLKSVERYFYEGEIKDQRCLRGARWILGIRSPIGEADLIGKTTQLLKICSAKFVPELVRRALPGLALSHLQVPPAAIAANVETQYFSISRTGPCWEHIMQTHNVGIYVPGELPSPEMDLIVLLES